MNARLLHGTENNVVAIQSSAAQHGPDGLFVYLVDRNETVSVASIEVSRQEGDIYAVSKGLSDGSVVVASGQSRLRNAARIAVRQAVPR